MIHFLLFILLLRQCASDFQYSITINPLQAYDVQDVAVYINDLREAFSKALISRTGVSPSHVDVEFSQKSLPSKQVTLSFQVQSPSTFDPSEISNSAFQTDFKLNLRKLPVSQLLSFPSRFLQSTCCDDPAFCDTDNVPLINGELSGLSCAEAWSQLNEVVPGIQGCPTQLAQNCPFTCNACPENETITTTTAVETTTTVVDQQFSFVISLQPLYLYNATHITPYAHELEQVLWSVMSISENEATLISIHQNSEHTQFVDVVFRMSVDPNQFDIDTYMNELRYVGGLNEILFGQTGVSHLQFTLTPRPGYYAEDVRAYQLQMQAALASLLDLRPAEVRLRNIEDVGTFVQLDFAISGYVPSISYTLQDDYISALHTIPGLQNMLISSESFTTEAPVATFPLGITLTPLEGVTADDFVQYEEGLISSLVDVTGIASGDVKSVHYATSGDQVVITFDIVQSQSNFDAIIGGSLGVNGENYISALQAKDGINSLLFSLDYELTVSPNSGFNAYHVGQYSPELIAAMISILNTETGFTVPVTNTDVRDIGDNVVLVNFTIGYTSTIDSYIRTPEFEIAYLDLLKTVPGLSEILFLFTSESPIITSTVTVNVAGVEADEFDIVVWRMMVQDILDVDLDDISVTITEPEGSDIFEMTIEVYGLEITDWSAVVASLKSSTVVEAYTIEIWLSSEVFMSGSFSQDAIPIIYVDDVEVEMSVDGSFSFTASSLDAIRVENPDGYECEVVDSGGSATFTIECVAIQSAFYTINIYGMSANQLTIPQWENHAATILGLPTSSVSCSANDIGTDIMQLSIEVLGTNPEIANINWSQFSVDLGSALTQVYGGPIVAYDASDVILRGVVTDFSGNAIDIRPQITVNNQPVTYLSSPVGYFSHTLRSGGAYSLRVVSPVGYACEASETSPLEYVIACSEITSNTVKTGYISNGGFDSRTYMFWEETIESILGITGGVTVITTPHTTISDLYTLTISIVGDSEIVANIDFDDLAAQLEDYMSDIAPGIYMWSSGSEYISGQIKDDSGQVLSQQPFVAVNGLSTTINSEDGSYFALVPLSESYTFSIGSPSGYSCRVSGRDIICEVRDQIYSNSHSFNVYFPSFSASLLETIVRSMGLSDADYNLQVTDYANAVFHGTIVNVQGSNPEIATLDWLGFQSDLQQNLRLFYPNALVFSTTNVYVPGEILGSEQGRFPEVFVQGRLVTIGDDGDFSFFYIGEHPPIPSWESDVVILNEPGMQCVLNRLPEGSAQIQCEQIVETTASIATTVLDSQPSKSPTSTIGCLYDYVERNPSVIGGCPVSMPYCIGYIPGQEEGTCRESRFSDCTASAICSSCRCVSLDEFQYNADLSACALLTLNEGKRLFSWNDNNQCVIPENDIEQCVSERIQDGFASQSWKVYEVQCATYGWSFTTVSIHGFPTYIYTSQAWSLWVGQILDIPYQFVTIDLFIDGGEFLTLSVLVEGDDPSYASIDWDQFVAELQVYLITQGYPGTLVWIPDSGVSLIRGRVEDSNGNAMTTPPSVTVSGIPITLNPDGTFSILMPDGVGANEATFSNPEGYQCAMEEDSEIEIRIVCTATESSTMTMIFTGLLYGDQDNCDDGVLQSYTQHTITEYGQCLFYGSEHYFSVMCPLDGYLTITLYSDPQCGQQISTTSQEIIPYGVCMNSALASQLGRFTWTGACEPSETSGPTIAPTPSPTNSPSSEYSPSLSPTVLACDPSEYKQYRPLPVCYTTRGSTDFDITAGGETTILSIPMNVRNFEIELHSSADSDVYLFIADEATSSWICAIGPTADCMLTESGTYGGQYFEYSGDQVGSPTIESISTDLVSYIAQVRVRSIQHSIGNLTYYWNGQEPCGGFEGYCTDCPHCPDGTAGRCDGTDNLICSEPSRTPSQLPSSPSFHPTTPPNVLTCDNPSQYKYHRTYPGCYITTVDTTFDLVEDELFNAVGIPEGARDVYVSVSANADVDLALYAAANVCVIGPEDICMSTTGYWESVFITYSKDDTEVPIYEEMYWSINPRYSTLSIRSKEHAQGNVTYSWNGVEPCGRTIPECRNCEDYDQCIGNAVPVCDGSETVVCADPTSSPTTPPTLDPSPSEPTDMPSTTPFQSPSRTPTRTPSFLPTQRPSPHPESTAPSVSPFECFENEFRDVSDIQGCGSATGAVEVNNTNPTLDPVFVQILPNGATNVHLTAEGDHIRIQLYNENGICLLGPGCAISEFGSYTITSMNIEYSFHDVQFDVLAQTIVYFITAVDGFGPGIGSYEYEGVEECAHSGVCRPCSEYDRCKDERIPICDGSSNVLCVDQPTRTPSIAPSTPLPSKQPTRTCAVDIKVIDQDSNAMENPPTVSLNGRLISLSSDGMTSRSFLGCPDAPGEITIDPNDPRYDCELLQGDDGYYEWIIQCFKDTELTYVSCYVFEELLSDDFEPFARRPFAEHPESVTGPSVLINGTALTIRSDGYGTTLVETRSGTNVSIENIPELYECSLNATVLTEILVLCRHLKECCEPYEWTDGRGGPYDSSRFLSTSFGWTCAGYVNQGWCSDGEITGERFGEFFNFPEKFCKECGASSPELDCKLKTCLDLDEEFTNGDVSEPMASSIYFVEGEGWTCEGYKYRGWCRHGEVLNGNYVGADYGYPERKCCACGGGSDKTCSDIPGFRNQYRFETCPAGISSAAYSEAEGWNCDGYEENGWCSGNQVVEPFLAYDYFSNPELKCCVCGGGERDTSCKDSCGWTNLQQDVLDPAQDLTVLVPGSGYTCHGYERRGWCSMSTGVPQILDETRMGENFNFPERNCLVCGKCHIVSICGRVEGTPRDVTLVDAEQTYIGILSFCFNYTVGTEVNIDIDQHPDGYICTLENAAGVAYNSRDDVLVQCAPIFNPSNAPTTESPTQLPTSMPTAEPSVGPSSANPTLTPSANPVPSLPSISPTIDPDLCIFGEIVNEEYEPMSFPPTVTINDIEMHNDHGDFWNCIRFSEGIDITFTENPTVDVHYQCETNITYTEGTISSLGIEQPYLQSSTFHYDVWVYVICYELTQTVSGRVVDREGSPFPSAVVIVYVADSGGLYQTLEADATFGPSLVRVGTVSIDVIDVDSGISCYWDPAQVAQYQNDILVVCGIADVSDQGQIFTLIGMSWDALTEGEWLLLISQITKIPVEYLVIDHTDNDVGVQISVNYRGDFSLLDDLSDLVRQKLYDDHNLIVYVLGEVTGDCSILKIEIESGMTWFNSEYAAIGVQGDGSLLYMNAERYIFAKFNSRWWRVASTSPELYLLSPASDDIAAYSYPHVLRDTSDWLGVTGNWGFEAISNGESSTGKVVCVSSVTQFTTYDGFVTGLYRGNLGITVLTGFGGNQTFSLNAFENSFQVLVELGVDPTVLITQLPQGMQCVSVLIAGALIIECQEIMTSEPVVLMISGVSESSISPDQYKIWLVGLRPEITFRSEANLEIQDMQYAGPGGLSGVALLLTFPTLSASVLYSLYLGLLTDYSFHASFQSFIRADVSDAELSVPLQATAQSLSLQSSSIGGSQWDGVYTKSGIVGGHSSFVLEGATIGFVRDLPWAVSINSYAEYVAPWVMNSLHFVDPPTDLTNGHTWTIRAQDYTQSTYVPGVTLTATRFIGADCDVDQFPSPLVEVECDLGSNLDSVAISLGADEMIDALRITAGSAGVTVTWHVLVGSVDVLVYVENQCIFGPDLECLHSTGEAPAYGINLYAVTTNETLLTSSALSSTLIFKTRAASDAQILLTVSSSASTNCQTPLARSCLLCSQYSCPSGSTAVCDGSHVFCS